MSDIVRMLRVSESDPVQQEAADEIERLRAELAAERENARNKLMDAAYWQEKAEHAEAERDALRAQLDDAREALEPFAKSAFAYSALPDGHPVQFIPRSVSPSITEGDLRRARAIYEKIKGGGDE